MGTIWVKQFTGGLDARRMPETTVGGSLIRAQDAHTNRGGEIEQRAAFVPVYSLPPEKTVGLAIDAQGLVVFGTDESVTLPTGVRYQRLAHPTDDTIELARITSTDRYAGKIYAVAEFVDGSRHHFFDGAVVTDWFDGRARTSFAVVSGAGSDSLTALTVGGVAVIGAAVVWNTSPAQTASDIAGAINAESETSGYTATVTGATVTIVATTPGAAENGKLVNATVSGTLVLTAADAMATGVDSDTAFQPGQFVRTLGSKVYSGSGPNLHFSGIQQPTKWTTDTVGAGFIDMSKEAADAVDLKAVAKYQNLIAVFAERTTLIFYVDPDPALNKESQVLNNTGTVSGRSVTQFGDTDLFYVDASGVRSLRARDMSNAAATSDIGVPIDPLVVAKLNGMTSVDKDRIISVIEPRDGRFWCAMRDVIYVFSYFPGSKVSAWSTYLPTYINEDGNTVPFLIDEMIVLDRVVFLRSGDMILAYGGLGDAPVYDATSPDIWLPFLDADTPTRKKTLTGIDAACKGDWEISVALQPEAPEIEDEIGHAWQTTFNADTIPAEGESTHFSLRFRGNGVGPRRLGSVVIHYEPNSDED